MTTPPPPPPSDFKTKDKYAALRGVIETMATLSPESRIFTQAKQQFEQLVAKAEAVAATEETYKLIVCRGLPHPDREAKAKAWVKKYGKQGLYVPFDQELVYVDPKTNRRVVNAQPKDIARAAVSVQNKVEAAMCQGLRYIVVTGTYPKSVHWQPLKDIADQHKYTWQLLEGCMDPEKAFNAGQKTILGCPSLASLEKLVEIFEPASTED